MGLLYLYYTNIVAVFTVIYYHY